EGYQLWRMIGLAEPKVIKEQRGEYRKEMDPIAEFLDDCCLIDCEEKEESSALYSAYKQWSKENNFYTLDRTRFGKEIGSRFQKGKSNGRIIYRGLALSEEEGVYQVSY